MQFKQPGNSDENLLEEDLNGVDFVREAEREILQCGQVIEEVTEYVEEVNGDEVINMFGDRENDLEARLEARLEAKLEAKFEAKLKDVNKKYENLAKSMARANQQLTAIENKLMIQFEPGANERGTYLLFLNGPFVGKKGGFFIVPPGLTRLLDDEKIKYKWIKIDDEIKNGDLEAIFKDRPYQPYVPTSGIQNG